MSATTPKKMTKKERYAQLLAIPAVQDDPELVEFIEHEVALLIRKNSAERKPTAKQVAQKNADADFRTAILTEMEPATAYSADDLTKSLPSLSGLTAAKVTYLLKELVERGKVIKTSDKRKMYYTLA